MTIALSVPLLTAGRMLMTSPLTLSFILFPMVQHYFKFIVLKPFNLYSPFPKSNVKVAVENANTVVWNQYKREVRDVGRRMGRQL